MPSNRSVTFLPILFLSSLALLASCTEGNDPNTVFSSDPTSTKGAVIEVGPGGGTVVVPGQSVQFRAIARDEQGRLISNITVDWASTDPAVATVDQEGRVTGVAEGVAYIRGRWNRDKNGPVADSTAVGVAGDESTRYGVHIIPKSDTINWVGGKISLVAVVYDSRGRATFKNVVWESLEPAIAGVDKSGVVTGLKQGVARITAKSSGGADTATVWVAPGAGATAKEVLVSPGAATIDAVGATVVLDADVVDASGNPVDNQSVTWGSLSPSVAVVDASGRVTGLARGQAAIMARQGTLLGYASVQVNVEVIVPQIGSLRISPESHSLIVGQTYLLNASVLDDSETLYANQLVTWLSLDPAIGTVDASGLVRAAAPGTARIVAHQSGVADTAVIAVAAAPESGDEGGGTPASIEVTPASTSIYGVGNTTQLAARVLTSTGAEIGGLAVTWASLDPTIAVVNTSGRVTAAAVGTARVTAKHLTFVDTAVVTVTQMSSGGGGSVGPSAFKAILGPIVARGSSSLNIVTSMDDLFLQTEVARYKDFLGCTISCSTLANHYGGLVSRLEWAIRNGEPYGAGVTDDSKYAYARGRRVMLNYLQYSKNNSYMTQPHNNTGMADVEALYILESNPDAWLHIHMAAVFHSTDNFGYLNLTAQGSDARQPSVALQSFSSAHRLGIPYAKHPANGSVGLGPHGSWTAAGQWLIDRLAPNIGSDGSIRSPGHGGAEAYLFNAMLTTQLLLWDAHVQPQPQWVTLAVRIMDHMVAELNRRGGACLPYLSSGSGCAQDLAGLFVRPALMIWQDTGDQKYYDFAMKNLSAARGAYVNNMKQWNQVFSTGAQTMEAFETGVSWR